VLTPAFRHCSGLFQLSVAISLISVRTGGRIAYIGVLTGLAGQANPLFLIPKMASINGIFVGNRAMFDVMLEAIAAHDIHPVIDREFPFTEAPAALARLRSGGHFGKIVVQVGNQGGRY
jgi:NADPH:quinone reductase-like Zn-dependent oxidoreductase